MINTNNTEKELTGYPSIDKPWQKYYSEEAINASLPECTIYEYLWENNKDHLDDVALIYFGRKISYGELFKFIDKCEKSLYGIGVKPKDIVTVALPSIPEALYLVYALNKMGAVANMIHPLAGENEIIGYLNEVSSTVCFMFTGTYEIIKSSLSKTNVRTAVVISPADSLPLGVKLLYNLKTKKPKLPKMGQIMNWSQFLNSGKRSAVHTYKKNPDEVAIISHTGGTTGVPKGVMCSDNNINTVIWEIGCNLPHDRQEKMLVVLPPFVNYSLVNAMLEPLAFGFQVILIPDYKPEKFVEYVKKYQPNHFNSIPAYWEVLLSIPEMKTADLSCLRHVFYGGEGMNEVAETQVNDLLLSRGAKYKLAKGLGSTEVVSAATVTYHDCNLLNSVGIPLVKLNCKIVNTDNDSECTYNQIGEICFSGPQLMLGYYHNQEATNEIIKTHNDGNRWIHTGDLGYINEDGILFVSGRIKRIIMTKGKDGSATKMFPDRIEKVIAQHSNVLLCCVIGIEDKQRINYAKAFVVLNDKSGDVDKISVEILDMCKNQLPEYMIPEVIEICNDLPRTDRGKVDYRALEKMVESHSRLE